MIPGLSTGMLTVLNQVSDDDVITFLLELDNILELTLTEIADVTDFRLPTDENAAR